MTTPAFLDHFSLEALTDLPGMEDLKASGMLDRRPAIETIPGTKDMFDMPESDSDDEDEDEEEDDDAFEDEEDSDAEFDSEDEEDDDDADDSEELLEDRREIA